MNDRDRGTRSDSPDGLDRWLREALVSEGGAVPSECLDPETLAAWAEGVLSGAERSFAEAHTARCARCQSMLAVMARTVPPETGSPRSSFRKWLMMLTPAAAAVAAVVVWVAVVPPQRDTPSSSPQSASPSASSAGAPEERAAARAVQGPVAPPLSGALADKDSVRRDAFERAGDKSAGARSADEAAQRDRRDPQEQRLARERLRPPAAESEPLAKRTEVDALAGAVQKGPVPPGSRAPATAEPPPGAVAEAVTVTGQTPAVQNRQAAQVAQSGQNEEARLRQQSQQQQQQAAPSPQQSTQQNTAVNAPPPPPAKPAAPAGADASLRDTRRAAGASRGGALASDSERKSESNFQLSQPLVVARDGKTRWRVSQRLIQQSVDGGATWSTQFTLDDGTVLVSGGTPSSPTAPSSVCWFVGASGAIVATSDGRTWRRVPFPYAVDLVGVTLTDTRHVVVTASDQRVFVSTDGGERWMAK